MRSLWCCCFFFFFSASFSPPFEAARVYPAPARQSANRSLEKSDGGRSVEVSAAFFGFFLNAKHTSGSIKCRLKPRNMENHGKFSERVLDFPESHSPPPPTKTAGGVYWQRVFISSRADLSVPLNGEVHRRPRGRRKGAGTRVWLHLQACNETAAAAVEANSQLTTRWKVEPTPVSLLANACLRVRWRIRLGRGG